MGDEFDEKSVFLRALELPPLERNAFLDRACPTPEARKRVVALLDTHAVGRGLLKNGDPRESNAVAPGVSGALGATSHIHLDEFELIRELGRGGMGVVHLARDTVLGRLVAIKVLAPHLVDSEQAVERFRQEGRAVAALGHPGIVPVHRAACSQGRHYIAMAYVEGETLHDRIRAAHPPAGDATPTGDLPEVFRNPERVRDSARIIADVAEALEHAHRAGVVHRDVKPSNVIVDATGRPHLTDFGIAKVKGGAALTTPGDLAGTAHYMSPEQADEAPDAIDRRSDVFSLGVVLYELLALRRPFDGPNQQRVLEAIRKDEPPDLRAANPLVAVDLSTICHKALEKRPQNRYQTAAHMAADLRSFLAGDPILARPPSAVRRARRWAKRHRASLAASVVVASLAITASAVGLFVMQERSRLCVLEVASGFERSAAVLRRMSDDGMELGEPINAGSLPLRTRVQPGIYRLAVISVDGRFVETTVSLLKPGEERRIAFDRPAPRTTSIEGMVFVPGGICDCGVEGREGPQGARRVRIAPFFIDQHEVSNAEYRRFVEETGAAPPPQWADPVFAQRDTDDLPVVGVSWDEAEAFARWAGKRLPTAAEWECAMRSPDALLSPWGDAVVEVPEADLAAVHRSSAGEQADTLGEYLAHALPVDGRPDLATPGGIFHAATNMTEWTASILVGRTTVVVIKGASWADDPTVTDLAIVRTFPLETIDTGEQMVPARSMKLGFRCARSAAP